MMFIESTRTYLRHFEPLDLDSMCQLFADPEVMRYSDGIKTAPWVRNWLEDVHSRSLSGDPIVPYAIIEKQSKALLGYCGLFNFPDIEGRAEIELGYRLHQQYWRQGYGKESAQCMCNYSFSSLRLNRLISLIDPANVASIKIALALGMQYETDVMLPGYDHPDQVYSIENHRTDVK